MKKLMFFVSAVILLSACASKKSSTSANNQMVGNDKDRHGCSASAGYVWSEVRNDCIRLFDNGNGIPVQSVDNADEVAYVVLSQDSLKAQLFYSGDDKHEVLNRTGNSQKGFIWKGSKSSPVVRLENNKWVISVNGEDKYKQVK